MSAISEDGIDTFKLIVIGQSGVGKTTLLLRFLEDKFADKAQGTVTTIGIDMQAKDVFYENHKFRLEVWDTAGQEKYRTIVKNYFTSSKMACIVFDITEQKSLDAAQYWLQQLSQRCDIEIPKLLLANKCDLLSPQELTQALSILNERIEQLKTNYGCEFHVVSGKSGQNVKKTFDRLIQIVYERYLEKKVVGNKKNGSTLRQMGKDGPQPIKPTCCKQ